MPDEPRSFLLTDEPWISVLDRSGRTRMVSVRELFAQAHELRGLACELPTQTFAILRLLLAILHRACDGPGDDRSWRMLWTASTLPHTDIGSYLDDVTPRFDLLHPVTPFYQVGDLHTDKAETFGLERLIADVPNGHQYLTSRAGVGLRRISFAEAARWLVHCQAYDTSGIKSGVAGDPRVKGGKVYPQGVAWCGSLGGLYLDGVDLRETLLLNLIPFDFPYLQDDDRDLPVWERPPLGAAEQDLASRGPYGRLGLYTWQSRRIRLFGDADGITSVIVAYGDKLDWDNRHRLEPMTGWRRSPNKEKQLKQPLVYLPAQHDPARALWRGLTGLLPASADATATGGAEGAAQMIPALSQWLSRLRINGHVGRDFRVTTRAVGVVYGSQQSVVDHIHQDWLTMTVQAFDTTSGLPTTIVDAAADADKAVAAVRNLGRQLCQASGGTGDERNDPPAVAGTRAAETAYAALDQEFRRWLAGLGPDSDPATVHTDWQVRVRTALCRIADGLLADAGPRAWVGRTVNDRHVSAGEADRFFRRQLDLALPLARARLASTPDNRHQEVPA